MIVVLVVLAACGGGSDDPTPTPDGETATPSATPTKRPPVPSSSPPATDWRLVIREFAPFEDVFWSVDPLDPPAKVELARIPHREGYGLKASLSPDGKMLAYLSMPDFAISVQSSQAEAYVMDLETKESVKLADGVDMTYAPMWSPDSELLYLRRYAGSEFLNATVSIIRVHVPRTPEESPTPSPTLAPSQTPIPTLDPIQVVISDSTARVLSFTPIGFADDNKSMFFVQVDGGTGGGTLIGIYAPASTEAVAVLEKFILDSWAAAEAENKRREEAAAAQGEPFETVTIAPTPAPDARFVVQISEGVAFDYALSPDLHKVAYLDQQFVDGEILNRTYIADLIEATPVPLPAAGLDVGHQLRPIWHPDGRLTVGVIASEGGPGSVALIALDGTSLTYLPQPDSGFDEPRSWAPDGSWLAMAHSAGQSLANPGEKSLVLTSLTGQRVTVIVGADNATPDSVLGWIQPEEPEAE